MLNKHTRTSQLAVGLAELQAALAAGWALDLPVQRKQIPDHPDGAWPPGAT